MTPKLAVLATALLLAIPHESNAQETCAPRAQVLERLADIYSETRQSIGLGQNNTLLEVFASMDTGSWTITVTSPSGVTCLIASGLAFETLAETLPVPTKDA
ncbi:hypothetical protein [Marivita sp. S2033]|uniref:hypothetical protein n=1 Tax=Marivita sp. S2033 TaxID=3373187 RepID=UPI0039820BCD